MEFVKEGIDLFFSDRFCFYRNAASVVGVVWLACFVLRSTCCLLDLFNSFFLAPLGITGVNLKKYGSWAVITGASEGIGRGYALELAKRGLNVVIMSRSEEKLQKVATEIKEKYEREVRVIPVDFSKGMDIYPSIAEKIEDLDIGILVNNVGLANKQADVFHNMSKERMRNIIEINCNAMVQMCKLVLPKMLQKRRGIIVNLSSSAGSMSPPMLTVYGGTKAFVNSFSEGLHLEYACKGIIVQNVAPFFVATAMSGIRRSNWMVASADDYARSAIALIGVKRSTHGTLSHTIQGLLVKLTHKLLPSFLVVWLTLKTLKGAKERYLKKKAKEK